MNSEVRFDRVMLAGQPAGVLVRRLEPGRLRTRLVYAEASGAVVNHTSEISYDGEPTRWLTSHYTEAEHGLEVTHTNPDPATPSVPTLADVLIVERLARVRGERTDLPVLHERDGEWETASYLRRLTDLGTPRGLAADSRVDVLTGAQLHARCWCSGGLVVATDWIGLFSFRVASFATAIAGVRADVAELAARDTRA